MISAIVPAYNEADRIAATVGALASQPAVGEVVVVDDGSADATAAIAQAAGARVVTLPDNQGKGAALARGAEAAQGDVLLLADADLGATAAEAVQLAEAVASGKADMAIATFPVIPGKGGGFGFVVKLARWGIHRATGQMMAAPLSGQRAMRREVWERLGGFAPGFGAEVALTIDVLALGYRVIEIPTTMTHRVTGRDLRGVLHRARQFAAVARALWSRRSVRC